jgi:hypothetical protein
MVRLRSCANGIHQMHTPDNPINPVIRSSASDIPLEQYITTVLSNYGVTHSQMNQDQNEKIEFSAASTRDQLHLHIVASATEAIILRDLYNAKISNVAEKLDAYIAYHKEIHSVLKIEVKKANDGIKALALALQAQLRQHDRSLAVSKSKRTSKKLAN